jgi:glycosyltransferase involved in cell wall biosynthesis
MRILAVSNLYPPVVRGGYEVECAGVLGALKQRGDDVLVLTSSLERERAPGDEAGVRRELAFLSPDERGSLRAPGASLRAGALTRAVLAEYEPELAYVWNGSEIPQAALALIAQAEVPIAYRVCEHWFGKLWSDDQFMRHLTPGDRGPRRAWAAWVRALNRHPALRLDATATHRAAICWNSDTIRRLAGVPACVTPALERVVHSTSTRAARFEALERRPASEPVLAFMGRLSPEKGSDVAVGALARLREEHGVPARLVLAGPGSDADHGRVSELAARRGVGAAVTLAGPLDGDGLVDMLASAHALVIPSVWQDPFPLVCIEGALARVPIVASDIGGIPECLHDREHALLVAPGDEAALAAALARTLGDPDATAERVARAFARGREFSYDAYLADSLAFVDEAFAALRT